MEIQMTKGIKKSIEKGTETIARVDSNLTGAALTVTEIILYLPFLAIFLTIAGATLILFCITAIIVCAALLIHGIVKRPLMFIVGKDGRNKIRQKEIDSHERIIKKIKDKMEANKC
jgi:hypothetical protein